MVCIKLVLLDPMLAVTKKMKQKMIWDTKYLSRKFMLIAKMLRC
jgi:hypothetical protein